MQQARIIEASREMVGSAMAYSPEGMMQIGSDLASFPEALANVAKSIQAMTRQVQEGDTPMDPAIVGMVRALHQQIVAASEMAKDIGPMFRQFHADDIKRIEQPRRNEQMWDYGANRDYSA
ncbi:hypothetical protein HY68_02270 [Streptomyces sp. AcH 505]|uniref:hypothetical protein n=1 Tax=Streptomyces sp. AcH 505 TaxID=352211 RepID=UPI000591FDC7|nr:hypothetical protein HY68_02270 [Streptomyces sp. AcH 505]